MPSVDAATQHTPLLRVIDFAVVLLVPVVYSEVIDRTGIRDDAVRVRVNMLVNQGLDCGASAVRDVEVAHARGLWWSWCYVPASPAPSLSLGSACGHD